MGLRDIAVITQFIDNTYCSDIFQGIRDFYKDKDVRLFILEARSPFTDASDNEYQFWASALLAQSKKFEAVILLSATYCTNLSTEKIKELFEPLIKAPVISISVDLSIKNSYHTIANCDTGFSELVKHLIQEHGAKKIGFVSAEKTTSREGAERLEAYKKALAENNLEFDPSIVIPSNFTQAETIITFHSLFKTKEDVKFDALMCANDYSALGAIYALKELGINIPDDVIVTGFDDCSTAEAMGVTSINQQIFQQGYEAANIAWKIINGESVNRITKIDVKPVFRRSCGCNNLMSAELSNKHFSMAKQFVDVSWNYGTIYSLLDKMQGYHTLNELYNLLARILIEADITAFAICLYKTPIFQSKGMKMRLPDSISLSMHYNHHNNVRILNEDVGFDPYISILPRDCLDDEPSAYIVNPIFFAEMQYGYLVYRPGKKDFNLYSLYMKIVSNSIAQAYEVTRRLEEHTNLEKANKELSISSRTDELTQVYNRRGFMFLGKKTIELALQMDTDGLVIFVDMDGLKMINDNYGHESGDKAIVAEAQILSKCFRGTDVIGRMGGDEFAIVASGMNEEILKEVRVQLENECSAWTIENKSPFRLSMSIGAVPFTKENCLLENLIAEADMRQYAEKRKKYPLR
ncbi:MAG: GGDEF domain-containing protein [Treponema sp.]|nr:GGDEF domain-containing protein [Treponema sp.]